MHVNDKTTKTKLLFFIGIIAITGIFLLQISTSYLTGKPTKWNIDSDIDRFKVSPDNLAKTRKPAFVLSFYTCFVFGQANGFSDRYGLAWLNPVSPRRTTYFFTSTSSLKCSFQRTAWYPYAYFH